MKQKMLFKRILTIVCVVVLVGCDKEKDGSNDKLGELKSKIAFISRRTENSGSWSLMTMKTDGSEQVAVTNLSVLCGKPTISCSGKKMLFLHFSSGETDSFYELYQIGVDGTGLKLIEKLPQFCSSGDWNIDENKVVYSRSKSKSFNQNEIVLYDCVSGNKTVLGQTDTYLPPKFSPSGQIAYMNSDGISCNIYLVNADGSNNRLLIKNGWSPVWSLDGRSIVYLSSDEHSATQLFTADSDGSMSKQLTFDYAPNWDSGFPAFGNYNPQWTPDSKTIVYVSDVNDGLPEIYSMRSDGSNKRRLTNTERQNTNPVISPDGKYILFSSNRDLSIGFDIYVMDINGLGQRPLSKYSGDDDMPQFVK